MKMFKKIILGVLIFAVMAASFTGCSKETTTDDGKTVIKWYAMGTKQADHDVVMAEFNKMLEEKYGMTLDLQLFNSADYDKKLNLIMASREAFDICFVSNWVNKFNTVAPNGALMPLDDLIDKHAPGLRDTLPDYMFKSATYNGKTYAIPNYQIEYNAGGIMVQKKLAEKYGLDMDSINSITDLEPFLAKVKENEKGIYPIHAANLFLDAMHEEIPGTYTSIRKDDKDTKVVNYYINDDAYKLLELCADWFRKGYIRQDIDSVTSDVADVNSNKYAVVIGTIMPGIEGTMKTKTGQDYLCKALIEPYVALQAGQSTMNAISATSTHPEAAIKFLEAINTDKELFNLLMFGIEGKHYEKIGENQIKLAENTTYNMGVSAWAFGNQFNSFYLDNQEVGIWEETDRINREAEQSFLIGFSPNIDNIKIELTALENVISKYKNIYVRDNWKELYKEQEELMKSAGIEKVINEIQNQIDNWKEN